MPHLHLLQCWHVLTVACALWHNAAAGLVAQLPSQAGSLLHLVAGNMLPVHCIDLSHLHWPTLKSLAFQQADGHCCTS